MADVTDRVRRILVVDEDRAVAESLSAFLTTRGYDVTIASDASEGCRALDHAERDDERGPFAVVVTELALPALAGSSRCAGGGLDLISHVRDQRLSSVVLAITGYASVETAVEAVRLGATDVLCKPLVDEELALAIERSLQRQALVTENRSLRQRLEARAGLESIIGTDPRMLRIYDLIAAVAPTKTTVLMTGESGTGKSLVARAIHRNSPRGEKPFVELSCGSIPESLLESELFGHAKGAFTGAHVDKKGRFLAAHGGTLFLDEINSASPSMQLKLLRVLQERRFEAVGSNETIDVDVRVVLASNQPLEQLVADGHFRQDLYYRINVVSIDLPPLRERIADIPQLANHFLLERCREHGRSIAGFTPEAMQLLVAYGFPGNVRELENVVERAVVLARGGLIAADDLPPSLTSRRSAPADRSVAPPLRLSGDAPDAETWVPMTLDEALREPERRILLRALKANAWNRQKTADQLGINRTTLYKKLKSLGLEGLERAG